VVVVVLVVVMVVGGAAAVDGATRVASCGTGAWGFADEGCLWMKMW
jgi:hypothetical protein